MADTADKRARGRQDDVHRHPATAGNKRENSQAQAGPVLPSYGELYPCTKCRGLKAKLKRQDQTITKIKSDLKEIETKEREEKEKKRKKKENNRARKMRREAKKLGK